MIEIKYGDVTIRCDRARDAVEIADRLALKQILSLEPIGVVVRPDTREDGLALIEETLQKQRRDRERRRRPPFAPDRRPRFSVTLSNR